jgi:hypothetical protein
MVNIVILDSDVLVESSAFLGHGRHCSVLVLEDEVAECDQQDERCR